MSSPAHFRLAVVTKATLRLCRIPKHFSLFSAEITNIDTLAKAAEELREVLLDGGLCPNIITAWNSFKMLSARQSYPWAAMAGTTPLDRSRLGQGSSWRMAGALYASTSEAEESSLRTLAAIFDNLTVMRAGDAGFDKVAPTFLGAPSTANLRTLYWRTPPDRARSGDPHQDGCGVLWLCPVVPLGAAELAEAICLIETHILAYGFEPGIGFHFDDPRAAEMFVSIHYDRELAGEDARARQCHDAVIEELRSAGYPFYRLALGGVRDHAEADPLMQRVKFALDPLGVLAASRYDRR